MAGQDPDFERLPECAADYIRAVIKRMRCRRRVRGEVARELADHFTDALADCTDDDQRDERARRVIRDFGEAKLLAVLIRRGKKRCRPAWQKAIIRSLQTCGVLIVVMILYTAWFVSGQAEPTVDYLAVLNEKSHREVPDEKNAWPHYRRAMELYTEPEGDLAELIKSTGRLDASGRKLGDLSDAEQKALGDWLEQNSAAWVEYVRAAEKPYCWGYYEISDGGQHRLVDLRLTHLAPLRKLSKIGIWRSRVAAAQTQVAPALADCLAVVRTGRHWHIPGTPLIEQLVALFISRQGHRELLQVIDSAALGADELLDIQSQLAEVYSAGYPLADVEGERPQFLDAVQRCFTRRGLGGGHLVPKEVYRLAHSASSDAGYVDLAAWTAASMVHARREKTLAKGNALYDQLGRLARMTPYERRTCQTSVDGALLALNEYRYLLLHYIIPSLSRVSSYSYQAKALHEATLTVLAARRWRVENGQYPASLSELAAAGYIEAVPDDPYSDAQLKYEPRGDDFVLYSLGGDFDDDGGVETDGDPWGEKEEGGDRVFWPVE